MKYTTQTLGEMTTPLWFCLRAQPKREHIAAAGLRRQLAIQCFSPRLRFRKPTQRGAGWFVEAMFPGYLFAEFVYGEFHRRVIYSPGVRALVRFGDFVPILEEEAIAVLRRSSADDEVITISPDLEVGDAVQVVEGPFRGLTALVTRLQPPRERVRILLEFLGREVETETPISSVLRTAKPRTALN
jgi:transcriptional antiterminator RfaH